MTPKPRGFAALTPERRREIASLGGKAQPASAKSFSVNPSIAALAGSKGGKVSRKKPVDGAV